MKPSLRNAVSAVAGSCLGMLFAAPALADAPQYTIENIFPIPEGAPFLGTFGLVINNAGQVAGGTSEETAFLYDDRDGARTGIDPDHFEPTDINEPGVVVGYELENPIVYINDGGIATEIGDFEEPGRYPTSFSGGINDQGVVVGYVRQLEDVTRAFVYADGAKRLLDIPIDHGACPRDEAALDINNAGQIVGRMLMPAGAECIFKAFLFEEGEDPVLIGELLPQERTEAVRLNESGQVLVNVLTSRGRPAGAYLYSDGELEKIGGDKASAEGLNDSGWVVGYTAGEEGGAFLYADGELHDLGSLVTDLTGWERLVFASDISDSGQITGSGMQRIDPDGNNVAFLLTLLGEIVEIDFRPHHAGNRIDPNWYGTIAVAVLTTPQFDASQVNWETVRLGPGGARERHDRIHLKDLGRDGDLDAVLHFKIRKIGIQCGDEKVTLTGETFNGKPFSGTDPIKVVNC